MDAEKLCLGVFLAALAVLIVAALLRAVKGPRFTDRMVAVNCITTLTVCIMAVLSYMLEAAYLLDVALIYALLGFLANVVLARILLQRRRSQKKFEAELLTELKKEEKEP